MEQPFHNIPPLPRGYFGVGVQQISKELNLGNLMRSAHAFGASFFFTLTPAIDVRKVQQSDTSLSSLHLPYYEYASIDQLQLPRHCRLVGVELMEESVDLPSFRHPSQAAYILGPEKGSLLPDVVERCDHLLKIPTKFCINVGVAGALVMYDRLISSPKFAERPVHAG